MAGRDHRLADGGMRRRCRLGGERHRLGSPFPPSLPSCVLASPRPAPTHPAPPPGSPGWYDLPDYKTALPCVCLFSVPDS